MKKTAKIMTGVMLILTITVLAFCSCGGSDAKKTKPDNVPDTSVVTGGTAADTSERSADGSDAVSETEDDGYVNPLEGAETVSEEIELNEEEGMSMAEYRLLKKSYFTAGDKKYTWFEFYNACVTGELKLTDPNVADFINECNDVFVENEFKTEADQAAVLVEALKGLN